jgi:hypothetical protein
VRSTRAVCGITEVQAECLKPCGLIAFTFTDRPPRQTPRLPTYAASLRDSSSARAALRYSTGDSTWTASTGILNDAPPEVAETAVCPGNGRMPGSSEAVYRLAGL